MCRIKDLKPQIYSSIFFAVILYSILFLFGQKLVNEKILMFSSLLLIVIPVIEIFRQKTNPVYNIAFTLTGILLFTIPFSFFNLILTPFANHPELYKPELLLGMMVIIWASDSGAYIFGSLLGKHKLAEKISPNKTWEGVIGGTIFSILISLLYFHFFDYFNSLQVMILATITIVAGTFGDLFESLIKRNFGVKDSGNLLPGHGGLYDRFDSLLAAAPVYYILIVTFLN
jgi:phosphatidate cytidylyltransferase